MQQDSFFVLELAHSAHGSIRRICIPHRYLYFACLALLAVGLVSLGLAMTYARMWWKVSSFNSLRQENSELKARFTGLQRQNQAATRQLASFQMLATEISQAYGIGRGSAVVATSLNEPLLPSLGDSIHEFRLLKDANLSGFNRRGLSALSLPLETPSLWPTTGRLTSHFGGRMDPFSGEGAFHTGIDISTFYGAPARVTANGLVVKAEYMGGYGNVVVVDHQNGFQTYYGHLAKFNAIPGQQVRRGQVVGYCGSTGRSTGVHLHYEIRRGNVPINPYPYMAKTFGTEPPKDFRF